MLPTQRTARGGPNVSMYSGKKRWSDMYDVVQPIARPTGGAEAPAKNSASTTDWSSMRKAQPADYLLPQSDKWFGALPPEVSPHSLAMRFPRIVNLIASLWDDRHGAPKLFEDLLVDRRGGRAGFPPAVRHDLLRLREFWYSSSPTPR
ncbi:MAG TPA: hypothetical protein VLU54_01820 [Casimicrobiaceae bacterium]|nr:hypothetical protein [Casimicrobiaceae bacterium]